MPLYYYRPFDFHADKKKNAFPVELSTRDVVVLGLFGLISTVLFVIFVVIPLIGVLTAG